MSQPDKPIATVAKLTGVSTDTLRAWERRYRLVTPERDAAGVRRYSDRDVQRISLARRATQLGHPIGTLARLSDSQLERLVERRPGDDSGASSASDNENVVEAAYDAVRRLDVSGASARLHAAALHMEPRRYVLDLLAPLLRRIGEGWVAGDVGIVQEHVASHLVRDMLGTFRREHATGGHTNIVFATPPQELHDLGLGLAACLAAINGAQSVFLGAQVPADELVLAATRLSARAVVVSFTSEQLPGYLEAYLRILDVHLPAPIALWMGGAGAERLRNVLSARIKAFPTLESFADYLEIQRKIWSR